jgi:hypothetical protein
MKPTGAKKKDKNKGEKEGGGGKKGNKKTEKGRKGNKN